MTRKSVKVFVSYASKNGLLVDGLLELLEEQLNISSRYHYQMWRDKDRILLGERWNDTIVQALGDCDVGLLLLSPAFFNSKYIKDVELPVFASSAFAKQCIPVSLEPVNVGLQDVQSLDLLQWFYLPNAKSTQLKSYADCTGEQRRRFAESLFAKIEQRMEGLYV